MACIYKGLRGFGIVFSDHVLQLRGREFASRPEGRCSLWSACAGGAIAPQRYASDTYILTYRVNQGEGSRIAALLPLCNIMSGLHMSREAPPPMGALDMYLFCRKHGYQCRSMIFYFFILHIKTNLNEQIYIHHHYH